MLHEPLPAPPDKQGAGADRAGKDGGKPNAEPALARFTVYYSRLGIARFLGHLELAKMIRRAIRRTGVRVKYSRGFSPVMKVSFDNPLPIGMESQEEFFTLHADAAWKPEDLASALNAMLPDILPVTRCTLYKKPPKDQALPPVAYRITLPAGTLDRERIKAFADSPEFPVEQTSFKGKNRSLDPPKAVKRMDILDSDTMEMVLVSVGTRTVRPGEILTRILDLPGETLKKAHILKLKTR